MALDVNGVVGAVVSHALALGRFERVNGHEPRKAPNKGLTAAVWVDRLGPAQSGLASTSVRLVLLVRVYAPLAAAPSDAIDPRVLSAVGALMGAYSGDFTLGGRARAVDLLGMAGTPLEARAGYVTQGATAYRVMTITLPILLNDVWDQVA